MSKVTVHGEGFRKDSPVLLNAIKCMKPSVESNYPFENGVRSLVHLVGILYKHLQVVKEYLFTISWSFNPTEGRSNYFAFCIY